jgi:hypothetical protein
LASCGDRFSDRANARVSGIIHPEIIHLWSLGSAFVDERAE